MSLSSLAEDLRTGAISLPEWESQMRAIVREQSIAAMELAKGGREFITQADWGYVGSQVKKQYEFLDGFASDIAADPAKWLNGRLDVRMKQYNQSGYAALEDYLKREADLAGWTEERRILQDGAENCEGCEDQARRSWVNIGSLPPIGSQQCRMNCLCHDEYRKPDGAGGWTESE